MNNTNSMKVSVNGRKYFISGIQKDTSHKEILCAIAKVTQSSYSGTEGEEGKPHKVNTVNATHSKVSIKKTIQVKRDCEDNQRNSIESFNTSRIDTGIITKVCKKNQSKERLIQSSKKNRRKAEKKQTNQNDQVITFNNSGEHKTLKVKNKKKANLVYINKVGQNIEKENLYHKSQLKRKHHKNSLESIEYDFNRKVSFENVKFQKLNQKVEKKTRKNTAWMNDFKNSTHIYYVDGKSNQEEDQKMITETLNYKLEKDSGLPSPDFNSCESQDQIKVNRFSVSHINIEQLFLDQLASIENERYKPPDNGTQVNKTFNKINNDKKIDSLYIQTEENNTNAIDLNSKINIDNSLSKATQNDNVNISSKYENLKQLLPTESFTDQPCEDFLLKIEPTFVIQNTPNIFLDLNENVVGHTDQSENIFFSNQTISDAATENNIMHDKKIIKTDISPPILMSPETIRKQKSLRKLKAVFGEDVSSTLLQMADKSNSSFIEKNNELNTKKKKEKRTKISKQNNKMSKEKSNEPEYISKTLFLEKPALEVLEYNVFRKKDKTKKSKPTKQKKQFVKVELLNNPSIASNDVDVNTCSEKMTDRLSKCEVSQNQTSDEDDKNKFKICSNNNEKTSDNQNEEMEKENTINKQNDVNTLTSEVDVSLPVTESDAEINSLEQQLIEATLSLLYIEEQTLDLNLIISYLTDELKLINKVEKQNLDEMESIIFKDLKDILGLLKSVTDLTTYQRQEMITNMNLIDKLDLELKTKKATIENLRSGSWRTNSNCAPRSLLRRAKKKNGSGYDKKFSFV